MIWDLHCHLAGFAGSTPQAQMANLMRYADRLAIDRVCVFMGHQLIYDPTPAELRAQNDEVLTAVRDWPGRAWGFVYLNPNHTQASLDELNRCVRDGPMVGVKLWVARRVDDSAVAPLIERAAELKALIFQHTWLKTGGNLPGESTPQDVVRVARRYPQVPIVCGHTGGNWVRGIRVIREDANIYADLAGSDPTAGFTEMAVRELGPERVLYGSDAGLRSFASQLAKVQGAAISEAARKLILGTNLARLLAPVLASKGVRP